MDETLEIKARLPIEELVAKYLTLKKKGRNFVALCPFHSDKHPSLLVSPDKGIAYCFACQKGGDIFSFYSLIEGCDFREALADLAEQTGVELRAGPKTSLKKDERERIRHCLESAHSLYRDAFRSSEKARSYVADRKVPDALVDTFGIGFAPDSFSETYDHLLKQGFSKSEILGAGLAVQKDLAEGRIYDRFRNRLMFPIRDAHGALVGFGGRTLGQDDAKYVNSSEGILYKKSELLFGMDLAKEEIRRSGRVILVEGYFDVLACHKAGVRNVVAVSGTALTEQHVKLLRRYADTVDLCLDQDRAGRDAAERAFLLLAKEGVHVGISVLPSKDPDELASDDPAALLALLSAPKPYIDAALEELQAKDLRSPVERRAALERVLLLLSALTLEVERQELTSRAAAVLKTTQTALAADLQSAMAKALSPLRAEPRTDAKEAHDSHAFTAAEVSLALLILYPTLRGLRSELIAPEEEYAASLFRALSEAPLSPPEKLPVPTEHRERTAILVLFCESHGFSEWSDSLAAREIRRNIKNANQEIIRRKQREISGRLEQARREGKIADEQKLQTEFEQVLRLSKMAG